MVVKEDKKILKDPQGIYLLIEEFCLQKEYVHFPWEEP